MDLEKFDKIPEIFENSKEILEKILKVKLTFYGKSGISETYKISGDFNLGWFGLFNNKFERFVLYLNNYDGKYSSDLLFMRRTPEEKIISKGLKLLKNWKIC